MIGLYQPGDTAIHRLGAGAKFVLLCLVSTVVVLTDRALPLAIGLLLTVGLYAWARVRWRVVLRLARPVVVMVALVVVVQGLFGTWGSAAALALRVVLVLALANLLTLTTPMGGLVDAFERGLGPLRRFGVNPERIGLLVALVLRFIPVLLDQAQVVREAQRARGVRDPRAFLVPLVIRTLRMADGLGEALEARGVDEVAPGRRDRTPAR